MNVDRVALIGEPGIADLRVAQRVAHGLLDRVETLALGRGDIDLEQQIRAAAQVETERHLLVRHPARQPGELLLGEQIGEREKHSGAQTAQIRMIFQFAKYSMLH